MMRKILFCTLLSLLSFAPVRAARSDGETLRRRGRELFEFGRWNDARNAFREARAALTPADFAAREEIDYYLAACAVELGRADAEEALLDFMRRYPGSVHTSDVDFALGSYYCARGDLHRAREHFSKCSYRRMTPAQRERYDLRMGYVAFNEHDYEQAYALFNRIPPESEYADHAAYYKAYMDYEAGRDAAAKEGFTRLLASRAYRELAPYYLLQLEFRAGNYRYVVDHGEELAARAVPERRAELERLMAESWFRLDDYGRTQQHLDAFAAAGGELDREGCYLRGFSLYRTARYDDAAEWLRRACGPEDALTQNASYHLADCYLRQGRKEEAMQAFAMATDERLHAEIAEDALFNYAKLQYELGGGRFNGAIHLLSRYLERYPASPRAAEARTLLVAAYYNSRDYDAAYRAIKALPSTDGELRAALQKIACYRGLEACKAGDLAAAKRCLDEAIALNVSPRYTALSRFWQGEIAYAEGDYEAAAKKFDAYLRTAPRTEREYALAWYDLGYCRFSSGETARAEEAFDRFLKLWPAADGYRGDAMNRLGDVAYADRRYDEAIRRYDRSVAAGGATAPYAAYRRAVTLGVEGRRTEQQQALQRILQQNTGDYLEEASYDLGRSYLLSERYAESAAQLERFVAHYPASPRAAQASADLGLAYLNLGDKQKSMAAYDRVVRSAPQSAEARAALQGIRDLYVSDGDVEGYFAYASRAGVESDLSALSRDSLSFAAAQKLYLADRRDDAERSLRSYLKSYPKGAYRIDALHYLGDCYRQAGQRDAAIGVLTELSEQGTNRYTLPTLRTLAALTREAQRPAEAARAYRKLYDASTAAADREAAMTEYVRMTVAEADDAKIADMAADVLAHADAGATARREAQFAWAEQLRRAGRASQAQRLYAELAKEVSSTEGSAAAYYVIEHDYADGKGDAKATERAIFAFSERQPKSYWLARAYLLLGDLYARQGDAFQARATYQSVADGYSPADDGIVAAAKERIQKLNVQ